MFVREIVNGNLLGDASIRIDKGKYLTCQQAAKDRKFLEWLRSLYATFGINCWISPDTPGIFKLGFYINTTPYPEFLSLREDWYIKEEGQPRAQKIIPQCVKLTPITLLFWYLGDGCLIRRKNDPNRIPFIVLATNCFLEKDLDFIITKLKEVNLSFYKVRYKSGFTGKECGRCLYSNTEDGTPFRFFKLIGLKCPKEIANCSTGSKGIYKEKKFFKDKWPTEEDWLKILSNVKVGGFLRERRLQLGLSQNQFGKKIGIRRENIRDVELEKRNFSVRNFRKILIGLNLDTQFLLDKLLN